MQVSSLCWPFNCLTDSSFSMTIRFRFVRKMREYTFAMNLNRLDVVSVIGIVAETTRCDTAPSTCTLIIDNQPMGWPFNPYSWNWWQLQPKSALNVVKVRLACKCEQSFLVLCRRLSSIRSKVLKCIVIGRWTLNNICLRHGIDETSKAHPVHIRTMTELQAFLTVTRQASCPL